MATTLGTQQRQIFLEEQHLAARLPQIQYPIRRSDWEHIRLLLRRCSARERSFESAFWSSVSIATTAFLSTLAFAVAPRTAEWVIRVSISITVASAVAAVTLSLIERGFKTYRSTSVEEALLFMEECEEAFGTTHE
jgi:hypothetical protein